jgi:hypothetical protein
MGSGKGREIGVASHLEEIIREIRRDDPDFEAKYVSYKQGIALWVSNGTLKEEAFIGKSVLDWECGRGVHSVLFLEMGARHVLGIDTFLDLEHGQMISSRLPGIRFRRETMKELQIEPDNGFEFCFANTATEHLIDLPQQLISCFRRMKPNGVLFINHDCYYHPIGSHDHGFLSYDAHGKAVYNGPECWSEKRCEVSEQFRELLVHRFPWTWDAKNEDSMDPTDCEKCSVYRRSKPWAHLIYQEDFANLFPVAFTSGHEGGSLNKATTFQLKQYIIEAGFHIEFWQTSTVANDVPKSLLERPYGLTADELITWTVTAVARKPRVVPNFEPNIPRWAR